MKQGLLIDMDGVIYSGEQMIQGADKFIANLLKNNIPFAFMTNNSQRTSLEAVRKLKRLGIEVTEDHVYTSAMAIRKIRVRIGAWRYSLCAWRGRFINQLA